MASEKRSKLIEAQSNLSKALKLLTEKGGDHDLKILLVSKTFEVLVEYSWRELKRAVPDL